MKLGQCLEYENGPARVHGIYMAEISRRKVKKVRLLHRP